MEGLDTMVYRGNLTSEEFKRLPKMLVTYFDYAEDLEIPDYLTLPTPMVSPSLQKVFQMYDDTMEFKGVQSYASQEQHVRKLAPLYFVYQGRTVSCLHEESKTAPNGEVTELVVNQRMIQGMPIVTIADIQEKITLVSLAVAESIVRRNLFGITFEEVRLK